jgi:DNA-binding transcriptional LysR family regulator
MEFPELPFLRSFVTIYETRSITRAAAELHRTQPSVTYQLQQLERALGRELFVRRDRRLEPTPLADQLYRMAQSFAGAIHEAKSGPEDPLRLDIAAVSAFGRYVLFPAVLAMKPLPNVSIRYPTADEVIRLTLANRCDVGFSYRAPQHPDLIAEPVYKESFVLIANDAWHKRLRKPADFRDPPVITYDEGEYLIGLWAGHHFGGRAPSWHSVAHFEELEEVLALVARGVGVSVVPDFMARTLPGVRVVHWGGASVVNNVVALRRRAAAAHPLIEDLVSRLKRGPKRRR